MSQRAVLIRTSPPFGIASLALMTRFRIAAANCDGSTRQSGTVGQRSRDNADRRSRPASEEQLQILEQCNWHPQRMLAPLRAVRRTRSCEVRRNPRVTPSRAPATKLRSLSGSSRLRSASLRHELIVCQDIPEIVGNPSGHFSQYREPRSDACRKLNCRPLVHV